jgi:hypothetical protein
MCLAFYAYYVCCEVYPYISVSFGGTLFYIINNEEMANTTQNLVFLVLKSTVLLDKILCTFTYVIQTYGYTLRHWIKKSSCHKHVTKFIIDLASMTQLWRSGL